MKVRPAIIRGKVIEFLKYLYPEGADERTVLGTFYEYYKTEDISQALGYLTDKGYVTKKELPHPCKRAETISVYKISPDGIDLWDGTVSDPGVQIMPSEDA